MIAINSYETSAKNLKNFLRLPKVLRKQSIIARAIQLLTKLVGACLKRVESDKYGCDEERFGAGRACEGSWKGKRQEAGYRLAIPIHIYADDGTRVWREIPSSWRFSFY
jgi:hypothetical protein